MTKYSIKFHIVNGETIYHQDESRSDIGDVVKYYDSAKCIHLYIKNGIRTINMANVSYFDVVKLDEEDATE